MPRPTHHLDSHHFALLDRIARRLSPGVPVDADTRRAVSLLTAAADPRRADRMAVQPGEPAVLVERLAVWALRRAPDDAVAAAAAVLDGRIATPDDAPRTGRVTGTPGVLVPCA